MFLKCDSCGAEEAVVHIRQIARDQSADLHLCARCAANRGIAGDEEGETDLSVTSLLTGLVEMPEKRKSATKSCPRCGTTAELIRKKASPGCQECYTVFAREIREVVGKMYGRARHTGKLPSRMKDFKTLLIDVEALKRRLDRALRTEDYEEAARLRDRIAELRGQAGIQNG
jgi:protein arginine kinase activator